MLFWAEGSRRNQLTFSNSDVKRSTWIVQHIFGAIQEYGGFDEPRWLG